MIVADVIRCALHRLAEGNTTAPITITRDDSDPAGLHQAERRTSNVAPSRRMLTLALVLKGTSRTQAAQAAGMDRQTLRDWVHRYNEDGLAGLSDRLGDFGPKRLLSPEQEGEVASGSVVARTWPSTPWCAGAGPTCPGSC